MGFRSARAAFGATSELRDLAPESLAALNTLFRGMHTPAKATAAQARLVERGSKALARIMTRLQTDPWPDDPAAQSGTEPQPDLSVAQRLWYMARPLAEGAAALASVQVFDQWRANGAVSFALEAGAEAALDVVDRLGEEALVVRASVEEQLGIRRQFPAVQIMPSAALYPQVVNITSLTAAAPMTVAPAAPAKSVAVAVHAAGKPVAGVTVRGYLPQTGYVQANTDANGLCVLRIPKPAAAQILVSAIPEHSYWSSMHEVPLANESGGVVSVALEPLKPSWAPAFKPRLGPSHLVQDGKGVRVAVIDTGVSKTHPLLVVAGGACTVIGEPDGLDWDDTAGHGTMVAGLIAARGDGVNLPRGLAPAAELHAYRVFGRGSARAEEVAVSKAIRQAVADGCDLINMSLGGRSPMLEVQRAMNWALSQGVVCIVAAGNDRRQTVSFPACCPEAIAVSAMGRIDAYPDTSEFVLSETNDVGADSKNYVSTFTNIGDFIDLCAPGVGIVSCWLGGTVAALNGTSFSAPLVTGLLARALSGPGSVSILQMPRNLERAEAIKRMAASSATRFGFLPIHEGHGLPAYP